MSEHAPDADSADTRSGPRRRLLIVIGLAWVLVTTTAVVFGVLWVRDGDARAVAREVEVNQHLWREEIADLRRIDAEVGTIWTYDRIRPAALADSDTALVTPQSPGRPYVLTVPDALGFRCEPGVEAVGDTRRVTVCATSPEGWVLGTSGDVPEPGSTDDPASGAVVGIPRPGGTDVRLEILFDVPGPLPTDLASTRRQLRRALAMAPDVLDDSDYAPLQAVDMDSAEWTDFEFMFRLGRLRDVPAPIQE